MPPPSLSLDVGTLGAHAQTKLSNHNEIIAKTVMSNPPYFGREIDFSGQRLAENFKKVENIIIATDCTTVYYKNIIQNLIQCIALK